MGNNEENLKVFLAILDPNNDQTGGGTASAIAGAMAAGLIAMVARLSIGKKDMPEQDAYYLQIAQKAQGLSNTLFDGARKDAEAFDKVIQAYRMPKSSDEEKSARSITIQEALIGATQQPLENAECCAEVLILAAKLEGKSNKNVASDLECGQILARAGLQGAISNVNINVGWIKDEKLSKEFKGRAQALM